MNTPILIIAFNRPSTLKVLLDRLKALGASNLFFAVDGPRTSRETDGANVAAVKALIEEYFAPSQERRLYQESNLGIRRGPPAALSWFFEQVEEGIVLEDDCIPGDSFLEFATWGLEQYRNHENVMLISGFNRFSPSPWAESHHFVKTAYIWGWASWRRAWKHYDPAMEGWSTPEDRKRLATWLGAFQVRDHWRVSVEMVKSGQLVTWDVAWCWTVMNCRGLAVMPRVSLIQNIGFGSDATNTAASGAPEARASVRPMSLTLPFDNAVPIVPDLAFQRALDRMEFWRTTDTFWERVKRVLQAVRKLLGPVKRWFRARQS